jgi:trigger factor
VEIADAGPCRKHLKVAVSRDDIDRQFAESIGELRREAPVPGFRPGRAPRGLVERRFRKEAAGQVKSALVQAAMAQVGEERDIHPIAPPKVDLDAISLPDDGPLRFEVEIEVQPDFPLPDYKSLKVNRPVKTITEADIDEHLKSFLERYGQLVPKLEGGAEPGDLVIANLSFHRDGVVLNEAKEVQFRLQPELRFQDGHVPKLAEALAGAVAGELRDAEAHIGTGSTDPALRGQTVGVTFQVLDLKRYRPPEVNGAFLESIGFDDLHDLRSAVSDALKRRIEFQQRQAVRTQILDQLVAQTPFDLPAELVSRQEKVVLHRQVLEMRKAGMNDRDIRAREAQIRANAHAETLRSLKEFFILTNIAQAEDVKIEEADVEQEIEAIAERNDESPRRVRARVEREGQGEALGAQILERKTLDKIIEYVQFEEVPLADEPQVAETIDQTAAVPPLEGSGEAAPEAAAEAAPAVAAETPSEGGGPEAGPA